MTTKPRRKLVRAWGGFVFDKIDIGEQAYGGLRFLGPAIFNKRRDAKFCYEDVRPVIIRELPRKRKVRRK